MPTQAITRGDDQMFDTIPPALLNGAGVITLLGWLYWMLASGRLVTRREHENRMADKDATIADKDEQIVMWRGTAETNAAQKQELLEQGRLSTQLLQAIEARARAKQDEQ
jgi:hypothetical protein